MIIFMNLTSLKIKQQTKNLNIGETNITSIGTQSKNIYKYGQQKTNKIKLLENLYD